MCSEQTNKQKKLTQNCRRGSNNNNRNSNKKTGENHLQISKPGKGEKGERGERKSPLFALWI